METYLRILISACILLFGCGRGDEWRLITRSDPAAAEKSISEEILVMESRYWDESGGLLVEVHWKWKNLSGESYWAQGNEFYLLDGNMLLNSLRSDNASAEPGQASREMANEYLVSKGTNLTRLRWGHKSRRGTVLEYAFPLRLRKLDGRPSEVSESAASPR